MANKVDAHFVDCTPGTGTPTTWSSTRTAIKKSADWVTIVIGEGSAGCMFLNNSYEQLAGVENPPFNLTYNARQDINGYIYTGSGRHTSGAYSGKVAPCKIDTDFNIVADWPVETDIWNTDVDSVLTHCRPTEDGLFVYALTWNGVGGQQSNHLAKLTADTGELVWQLTDAEVPSTIGAWDFGILANGNIIVDRYDKKAHTGNAFPAILSGEDKSVVSQYEDAAEDNRTFLASARRIIVKEDLGRWFSCGVSSVFPLTVATGSVLCWELGSGANLARLWEWQGADVHTILGMAYKNNYLYCAGTRITYDGAYAAIWKINIYTGTVDAYNDPGFGLQDVFIKGDGTVVATRNNQSQSLFIEYDDNLNILNTYNRDDTPISAWQVYRAEAVPEALLYGSATVTTEVSQGRTVAYPQDYSHLEGETCQVLADGWVHPDVVISGGEATLNDTYTTTHVGLQYTSKLLPMKPDGELYTKRIAKIFLQFVDTLGGLFGETEDSLDTVISRDAGDPMDDSPPLFTGEKELSFPGSYNRQGDIWVEQYQQLPMKLIGIVAQTEMSDGS